jgi:hypothetical protein
VKTEGTPCETGRRPPGTEGRGTSEAKLAGCSEESCKAELTEEICVDRNGCCSESSLLLWLAITGITPMLARDAAACGELPLLLLRTSLAGRKGMQ